MSGEKIDLGKLERELHRCKGAYFDTDDVDELLALVRAVRAARAFAYCSFIEEAETRYVDLYAALAPFTDSNDSAEVS